MGHQKSIIIKCIMRDVFDIRLLRGTSNTNTINFHLSRGSLVYSYDYNLEKKISKANFCYKETSNLQEKFNNFNGTCRLLI